MGVSCGRFCRSLRVFWICTGVNIGLWAMSNFTSFFDERLLCCTPIPFHLLSLHTKNDSFSTEHSRSLLLAIASLKRKKGKKKKSNFPDSLKKKKFFL